MLWIFRNYLLKVRDCGRGIVCNYMQGFAETKVCGNRVGLDFERVAVVLGGLLVVTRVGQQGCQVDSGSEMLLVYSETLLECCDCGLILTVLFASYPKIEERACRLAVRSCHGPFVSHARILRFVQLLVCPA